MSNRRKPSAKEIGAILNQAVPPPSTNRYPIGGTNASSIPMSSQRSIGANRRSPFERISIKRSGGCCRNCITSLMCS